MAKRRTAAQRAATRKLVAFNRRRRKGGGGRKRGRSRARVAARRRPARRTYAAYRKTRSRRRVKHLAPSRRYSQRGRAPGSRVRRAGRTLRARRWALRGNPGIVATLQQGAIDAACVVGGEITTNLVESFIPDLPGLNSATMVGKVIKRTGAAFGSFYLLGYVPGIDYQMRRLFLAGGIASVIKTGIRGVAGALPAGRLQNAVTQALSGDEDMYGVGSYPESLVLPGVGAYPEGAPGVGDYYEEGYQ